jgi:hypothetical protein
MATRSLPALHPVLPGSQLGAEPHVDHCHESIFRANNESRLSLARGASWREDKSSRFLARIISM